MPETDHRIYLLAGAALFAIGFHSLLVQAHLLRRIMAVNVMGSGTCFWSISRWARKPAA